MEDITDADYMLLKRADIIKNVACILKVIHYYLPMFFKTLEKCV